jgi:hypothetical protein
MAFAARADSFTWLSAALIASSSPATARKVERQSRPVKTQRPVVATNRQPVKNPAASCVIHSHTVSSGGLYGAFWEALSERQLWD